MNPSLSVVVPVRNDPEHLRACLDGLKASTYTDHEVLVVDDASTDDSGALAGRLGARVLRLERRAGPAAARNRGALEGRGTHLVFIDADVRVHPETLERIAAAFASDPTVDALFGSYDLWPSEPNLISQYKNLAHRFVHQRAASEASTFWTGCGAIRRDVFLEFGGFDTGYGRPCIEDIELGARLRRAGRRIVVRKDVEATHLKCWTLPGMLRSDFWDRALPWTELSLREGRLPSDLNVRPSQRLAALLTYALAGLFVLAVWRQPILLLVPIVLLGALWAFDIASLSQRRVSEFGLGLLGVLDALAALAVGFALGWWALPACGLLLVVGLLNADFYGFFARERHVLFAVAVVPLHLLYYVYSGAALGLGVLRHAWRGPRRRGHDRAPAREGEQQR